MAQPSPDLLDECLRASAALDSLIADMMTGRPSQTSHDGHIDQVEQIIERLRTAARGPGRPVNPPAGKVSDTCYVW